MVNLPAHWTSQKMQAIEIMVDEMGQSNQVIGDKVGVTRATIHRWLKDPEFVEVLYQKYMITFGSRLPVVLNAMIREAEGGNVQAGRLILEHSGKLIKRVEIANTQSPFEKFLDSPEGKEIPAEIEYQEAEFEVFPQRPDVPQTSVKDFEHVYKEKVGIVSKAQQEKTKKKRKIALDIRNRAHKVGLILLGRGRHSNKQRREWMAKLEKMEADLKENDL